MNAWWWKRLLRPPARGRGTWVADGVRLPLQTMAAVLLAYGCMTWLRLPEIAWGAFSALFVVRASIEGTIGEATGRILGALIGVALGVSMVLLCQVAAISTAWSIVAGVGVAAYISMRWPMLSYGLVTVTILTVDPGDDILNGALQKSIAIAVGSASGILAAAAILPLSARHGVRSNLAALIEAYGDLLVQWASTLDHGRQRPRLHRDGAMEQAHQRAQNLSSQARSFPADLLYRHTRLRQLHDRIDRLWRTAPLIERAGSLSLSDNICRRLGPALERVAAAAQQQIAGLAGTVRHGSRGAAPRLPAAPMARLDGIIDDAIRSGAFGPQEKEAVEVIRWAWHEIARELDALADQLDPQSRARRPAGA